MSFCISISCTLKLSQSGDVEGFKDCHVDGSEQRGFNKRSGAHYCAAVTLNSWGMSARILFRWGLFVSQQIGTRIRFIGFVCNYDYICTLLLHETLLEIHQNVNNVTGFSSVGLLNFIKLPYIRYISFLTDFKEVFNSIDFLMYITSTVISSSTCPCLYEGSAQYVLFLHAHLSAISLLSLMLWFMIPFMVSLLFLCCLLRFFFKLKYYIVVFDSFKF